MSSEIKVRAEERRSLFWQVWWRSLTVKRPQAALAVGSMVVGAAVASMLLNLYGDVRRKMTQEFRAYGANILITPRRLAEPLTLSHARAPQPDSDSIAEVFDEGVASRLEPFLKQASGRAAVPLLYAVVRLKRLPPELRLAEFQNLVAVGVDFAALNQLYPSWKVQGGSRDFTSGALLGAHAASQLHLSPGDSIQLERLSSAPESSLPPGPSYHVTGVVSTGASEDDQVFVPLSSLQKLAGLGGKISVVELSVPGETGEIETAVKQLGETLPGVEVRPLRQIVYSSGKVLGAIRWMMLSLTALIVIIIALCVMATMTAIVLERRKEIAVMKALGAGDRLLMELFLTEAAGLGLVGALIGFGAGVALAEWVARQLFDVSLTPSGWTFPAVLLSGAFVAVGATLLPVRMVRRVETAAVLRGE
jgi:putative ABC transport system permease protein